MAHRKHPTTRKTTPTRTTVSARSLTDAPSVKASIVYSDFVIYRHEHAPRWHPIRKMRYVFFRMIGGCTITEAIDEIAWNPAEFWHLVDLKRHGPFRLEYKRAKQLQGRAFADSVVTISEGRDRVTKQSRTRLARLLKKTLARAMKTKNPIKAKMLLQQLANDLRDSERDVMTRNKMQMDASKWLATKVNPTEFGEKTTMSLGAPDDDEDARRKPLVIQFIGPDGKAVDL